MAIYLTCGVPGAGKTLHTICTVEERCKKENREVYYSGIEGLTLDWISLPDPSKWNELPKGAIIVIDEAQRVFPLRKQGAQVPEFISPLETHRHKGYDIYLITQSPQLIDIHVRKLVGDYKFLDRPYNQSYTVVWRFRHVCDWKSTTEQATAEKARWTYPKEAFKWYKSAEVHTHKKRLPRFLIWIPALILILSLCGYALISVFSKYADKKETVKNEQTNSVPAGQFLPQSGTAYFSGIQAMEPKTREILTTVEYVSMWVPRLPEMPFSAPVYDEIAKPTTFPKVASCILGRNTCECFTQQATRILQMDKRFCIHFVENGQFDPFVQEAQHTEQPPPSAPPQLPIDQRNPI
jgi:hypothetical protein